jgi:hypothetical protein
MKLNPPKLSFTEKLDEFDFWITPALGEIRSSSKYKAVLASTCSLIEIIGSRTNQFGAISDLSSEKMADAIIAHAKNLTSQEKMDAIESLATFLFLVTGKTDNNSKCQFPIFLRDIARIDGYPKISGGRTKKILSQTDIPREIKSEKIARLFSELSDFPAKQYEFLSQYISFILDGDAYIKSLWTIGNSYFESKKLGLQEEFLQPLIIFQVRGSVSASGGHEPEDLLRERMLEWGLRANIDFNNSDIIIGELALANANTDQVVGKPTKIKEIANDTSDIEVIVSVGDTVEEVIEKVEETIKNKTRAYDFVLPYNVPNWKQHLFIQCQFYAGDSGSVSHKNVDQTRTSREFVKTKREDPVFIEYIDGAGYFSSLWGDLKKILFMEDTDDFFQVRTSVIKLRAKLQSLGFLTPLEIVHAWALMGANINEIKQHLLAEGYEIKEINRVLLHDYFKINENTLIVHEECIEISRRYLLLDFIATKGRKFIEFKDMHGVLLVPAFGKFFGIRVDEVIENIVLEAGKFSEDWSQTAVILKDIQFLADKGWIAQR